ncbi:MAG: hypothetical protein RL701_6149 [Pseudomonadota bacterium]
MKKPVIVYAASGYTGRLACEWLAKLGVPFVAAGRNLAKLESVVKPLRALGADCEASACEHTPEGLNKLLLGSRVVINISGPFSLLGREVVQAALDNGVHYVDSTGEQDFMFDLRRDFGQRFAAKELLLSPSAAFLWGPGAAAAELCLETPGIEDIETIYAPPSLQTVASLQSMFRSVRRGGDVIRDGSRTPADTTTAVHVQVPRRGKVGALCVAAGEATFLAGDARVRHCRTYFANDALARAATVFGAWEKLANNVLGHFVAGEKLDRFTDAAVLRFKSDPPAEDPAAHRFIVQTVGIGAGQRVKVLLEGTSPYVFTGFTCALAAQELLAGRARRFGYASLGQAFGARHVLARFSEAGTETTYEVTRTERALINATHNGSAAA